MGASVYLCGGKKKEWNEKEERGGEGRLRVWWGEKGEVKNTEACLSFFLIGKTGNEKWPVWTIKLTLSYFFYYKDIYLIAQFGFLFYILI